MSNYSQVGNRYTAIYLVVRERGDKLTYRKLPFEIVRFNVDEHPSAAEELIPCGVDELNASGIKQASDKIYEKIWIVDSVPFSGKTSFGQPE